MQHQPVTALPTKDLRCIARTAVSGETARVMTNETNNSNSKIKAKKETTMKMTTLAKASILAATLGFVSMLAPAARAQADAMPNPDEFPFSAPEATAAQPVQLASANS